MRHSKRFALYALAGIAASGLTTHRARADEKGDDLLRQVRETARALAPLVGEYTVTLHGKAGDTSDQNQAYLTSNGVGWKGGGILPNSVFNLFDPVTRVPAETRYLGRKTIGNEAYDVVELKLPTLTFQLYVGSDRLIHRAHTTVGTAAEPAPFLDPKTGRPSRTLEQMMAERVAPPTKTDAHDLDVVVTSYHKPRSVSPRPELPPPLFSFVLPALQPGKRNSPVRLSLSPDGARAAVTLSLDTAQIFDVASGNPLTPLAAPLNIRTLVFSPDGTRLAAAGDGQVMALYDPQSGRKLCALDGASSALPPVFTPDGKRVACANPVFTDNAHALLLWDAATGQALPSRAIEGAAHLAFSPDGKHLATISSRGYTSRLLLWDAASGKLLHTESVLWDRHARPVYSPDSQCIALAGPNSVLLFSGDSGIKQRELTGDTGQVCLLQFAANGKTLIAIDNDTRGDMPSGRAGITVWETGAWQKIGTGSLPQSVFMYLEGSVSLAANGKTFAVADLDRALRVWAVPGQ